MSETNFCCAFCGREYEFEDMCESDDCPSREAEIEIEKIGKVPLADHGSRDEMVLLTIHNHDTLTPAAAEQWLLPQVYRDTNTPGAYFCHSVTAMQHPYAENKCFAIIHHRWDV